MSAARRQPPPRARDLRAVGLLVVLGTLAPLGARAQAPSEMASTNTHDRALALFEQSVEAYRAGRFADAATLLREAHGLEPAPVLLYNLARALDADGQLAEARDTYRRYLAEEPEAAQRASCERRIEVLTAQLEAVAPPPTASPEPATPIPAAAAPPRPSGSDLVAPMLVVGLGAAVAIGGGALIGVASERYGVATLEPVSLRAGEIEAEAITLRDAGVGLLVVGGVATLAGAVWAAVASFETEGGGELEARVGPTGVTLAGRF